MFINRYPQNISLPKLVQEYYHWKNILYQNIFFNKYILTFVGINDKIIFKKTFVKIV